MESVTHRPSPPGGTPGTGGLGRAVTADAEEQFLGWTGGEGEDEDEDRQKLTVEDERGEPAAGREREPESGPEAGQEGVVPQFDSGSGGRDGPAVHVGEDGRQTVVAAPRQVLRPGKGGG